MFRCLIALTLLLADFSFLPAFPCNDDDYDPNPQTLERLVKALGSDACVRDLLATIRVTGEVFCYAGHLPRSQP